MKDHLYDHPDAVQPPGLIGSAVDPLDEILLVILGERQEPLEGFLVLPQLLSQVLGQPMGVLCQMRSTSVRITYASAPKAR